MANCKLFVVLLAIFLITQSEMGQFCSGLVVSDVQNYLSSIPDLYKLLKHQFDAERAGTFGSAPPKEQPTARRKETRQPTAQEMKQRKEAEELAKLRKFHEEYIARLKAQQKQPGQLLPTLIL